MRAFAELLDRLSLTASRNAKLTLVRDYLAATSAWLAAQPAPTEARWPTHPDN